MSEKVWLGGVFLKNGGYEIVLKSLNHYKKRLRSIKESPELKESAAMFASVLEQEAMKTFPKINQTIQNIQDYLVNKISLESLQDDLPIMEKALTCYQSDINKAQDIGHQYYLDLIGDVQKAKDNIPAIDDAKSKIKEFE